MHFNGLNLSGALEEFSIISHFWGSKMQKNPFFEGNKGFECRFSFRIEEQVISNPSSLLDKIPNPCIFAYERV